MGGHLGHAEARLSRTVRHVEQVEAARDFALVAGMGVRKDVEVADSRCLFGEQGGVPDVERGEGVAGGKGCYGGVGTPP